ncbi:MAG TPA: site-2 protease family protein [Caldilineaceae bacterium]|nr:site-2 protease family protein [Caldilineaceae bacterium]
MRSGFQLMRLFGINIRLDWSWLLIFLIISWNLSFLFGQSHPDWGYGQVWIVAISAALLFFISVLLHELAHSLTALALGLPVKNITLFLFGGVSNIEREPPSPRAEFLITVVGPATSILLGLLFTWLGIVSAGITSLNFAPTTTLVAELDPLPTLLLWLGPINLILGIFNLIPGFPLDGGRLLRSVLWAVSKDLTRATRWAAGVGRAVAWLFIFGGAAMIFGIQIPFFGSGFFSGLWLIFIGWFLSNAAAQSYQQVLTQDLLGGVAVARIMRRDPPTVQPSCTLSDLVDNHIMKSDDHAFPVVESDVEGDQLVGLVTLDDMRRVARSDWDTTTVRQIMTATDKLVLTTPEEDADDALRKLSQQDVRQLPVVQGQQLLGLLRRRDIMRWLQFQGAQA